ncbi:hypothetical protein OAH18_01290 [bacterium]|nr:hypothetical protein [bacterium]
MSEGDQSKSKQRVEGSKIGGQITQSTDAKQSDQLVKDSEAASLDQSQASGGSFNFGTSTAQGKLAIIVLGVVLIVALVVGLLKVL